MECTADLDFANLRLNVYKKLVDCDKLQKCATDACSEHNTRCDNLSGPPGLATVLEENCQSYMVNRYKGLAESNIAAQDKKLTIA